MATSLQNTNSRRRSKRHKIPDESKGNSKGTGLESATTANSNERECSIFESEENNPEGVTTIEEINFFNQQLVNLFTYENNSSSEVKINKRTYSNKRKINSSYHVAESFCLPDEPIISECPSKHNKASKLDINALEARETTILDLNYLEEPWKVSDLEPDAISTCEEVRYKNDQDKEICRDRRYSDEFISTTTPEKCDVYSPTIIKIESRKAINISVLQKNIRKVLAEAIKDGTNDDMRIEILGEGSVAQCSSNVQLKESGNVENETKASHGSLRQRRIKCVTRSPRKTRNKTLECSTESDSDVDGIAGSESLNTESLPTRKGVQEDDAVPKTALISPIRQETENVSKDRTPVRRSLRCVKKKKTLGEIELPKPPYSMKEICQVAANNIPESLDEPLFDMDKPNLAEISVKNGNIPTEHECDSVKVVSRRKTKSLNKSDQTSDELITFSVTENKHNSKNVLTSGSSSLETLLIDKDVSELQERRKAIITDTREDKRIKINNTKHSTVNQRISTNDGPTNRSTELNKSIELGMKLKRSRKELGDPAANSTNILNNEHLNNCYMEQLVDVQTHQKKESTNLHFNFQNNQNIISSTPRRSQRITQILSPDSVKKYNQNKDQTYKNTFRPRSPSKRKVQNQLTDHIEETTQSKNEDCNKNESAQEGLSSIENPMGPPMRHLRSSKISNSKSPQTQEKAAPQKMSPKICAVFEENLTNELNKTQDVNLVNTRSPRIKKNIDNQGEVNNTKKFDSKDVDHQYFTPWKKKINSSDTSHDLDLPPNGPTKITIGTNRRLSDQISLSPKNIGKQGSIENNSADVSLVFPRNKSLKIFKVSDKISQNKGQILEIANILKSPEIKKIGSPEISLKTRQNTDRLGNQLTRADLSNKAKLRESILTPTRRSLRLASQEEAGPSKTDFLESAQISPNKSLTLNPLANGGYLRLSPMKLNRIKKEIETLSLPTRTTKRLEKLGIYVISSPEKDPNDVKTSDLEGDADIEANVPLISDKSDSPVKAEGDNNLLEKGITSEVRVIISPMDIDDNKEISLTDKASEDQITKMRVRPKSAPPGKIKKSESKILNSSMIETVEPQRSPLKSNNELLEMVHGIFADGQDPKNVLKLFRTRPKSRVGRKRRRHLQKNLFSDLAITPQQQTVVPDIDIDLIKSELTEYERGNIVWAQLGKHPYWPSLVCDEPISNGFMKTVTIKESRTLYHVRFFGDKGRRAWVQRQQIMLYCQKNDLELICNKIKFDTQKSKKKFINLLKHCQISRKVVNRWQMAVEEAESVKSKSYSEILDFFEEQMKEQEMLELKFRKRTNSVSSSSDSDIPLSSMLERKDDFLDDDRSLTDSETVCVKRKPSQRFNSVDDSFSAGQSPVRKKKKCEEKIKTPDSNESLTLNFNMTLRQLRPRKLDETADVSSKNRNDTTPPETYSIEAQNMLFKNNKLFKGVSKEKVCQHCLKFGDVLKCKGLCGSFFHFECGPKVVFKKKKYNRKSDLDSSAEIEDGKEPDGNFAENNVPSNEVTNSNNENRESLTIEDLDKYVTLEIGRFQEPSPQQVEIVTVPSYIYNTPPRRTFPPNFGNMSLSDQIDFKMMEIMSKFDNINQYLSDPSSPKICTSPRSTNFGINVEATSSTNFSFNLNDIERLDEDSMSDVEVFNHVTAESSFDTFASMTDEEKMPKPPQVSPKKPKLKKASKIKHVTADSISFDTSTNSEESTSDIMQVVRENFKCGICISDIDPHCFVCQEAESPKGSNIRHKCSLYHCRKYFHIECLKFWPQTQWSLIQTTKHKSSATEIDSFVCPAHVCHTCASEDPRSAERCSGDKIVKCLRCPASFHSTSYCIPAGTDILTSSQVVCPRHRLNQVQPLNTTWCFICSEGGDLICCETCPTSVHPECLPINVTDDDKFICEDCESGRFPLYDEIVWVKLGNFPWWPALILFPTDIPENLRKTKHHQGDFAVKFFGTNDHCWANRSRCFLYQEGDSNEKSRKNDENFLKAVAEAAIAHRVKKDFKLRKESENINSLKPPPYIRIKVNKPVGNIKTMDLDLSNTTACDCDPSQLNPCGPETDCINRLLLTECSPEVCPAGKRCRNQSFKKREYPPVVPYKTMGRGWGLKTLAPIKKGQFVIEYVGELIDEEEYQRRIIKMDKQKEENYYFLTLTKDRMIDAGPKGNLARFMNHSCDPNCETQKWTVNGDVRVGLFALNDISTGSELTFNYNLECVGEEKKKCMCQAGSCSGFIGAKKQTVVEAKKPKKTYKKKKLEEEEIVLPPCFICGKQQSDISCANKICTRAYHTECLDLSEIPEANKFTCPVHYCNICSKRTIRCCVKCINSYCPPHAENNVRYDWLIGFVCNIHDPLISKVSNRRQKRKKHDAVSEEPASTSTAGVAGSVKKRSKSESRLKFKSLIEQEIENDNDDCMSSSELEISESKGDVSSGSQTDDEDIPLKRRGRQRRKRGRRSKFYRSKSVGTSLDSIG